MAIKKFEIIYGTHEASATFTVDTAKFTAKEANDTLTFFHWDYDKEADPIDEVLKKYAMKAIKLATFNSHNEKGVILDFEEEEGYYEVDGTYGITLIDVEGYEFYDQWLTVKEVSNGD